MNDEMDVDEPASEPKGVKRKASNEPEETRPSRRIKALDMDVVNKIAAGEIIVAPVNALKELVENAVDAGSTAVEILVKDGGLKMLQITDNGHGIQKDDLAILCERHTTSKITSFEDLASIGTYGFRGEALASISHIAHLTVTTKTKDSPVAWRAHYLDGVLVPAKPGQTAEPKGVAGRPGTQITVEDLFFSIPLRRRAFRSPAEEYNKIVDMVGRYAVHCAGVAFTCKKAGDSSTSISVQASATVLDRVRIVYGSSVANELVDFSMKGERWGYTAHGLVTNANFNIKRTTFLLFINHRSVESPLLKKAVEQVYVNYLPKGGHPFVYLSLEIDPVRVDVNVHPTKKEVHFLNEDEISQAICARIDQELETIDTSRTFKTQTILPGASSIDDDPTDAAPSRVSGSGRPRRNSNQLVRTDNTSRKITSMFLPEDTGEASSSSHRGGGGGGGGSSLNSKLVEVEPPPRPEKIDYGTNDDREPVKCRLKTVKELRSEVRDDMHEGLTEVFASHVFVGVVDESWRLAAIQGGIKLFLVDYGHACFEYFYQLGLTDFGNFGVIRFQVPLNLRELLTIAAETEKEDLLSVKNNKNKNNDNDDENDDDDGDIDMDFFDVPAVVEKVATQLIERREMLNEYFCLEITPAGELVSLPLMVKGYTPPIGKLPRFLLRLGPNVTWTEEKACFQTFLRELAAFYVPEKLPTTAFQDDGSPVPVPEEVQTRRQNLRWNLEHIFFPAFKTRLVATRGMKERGVMEIANLKGLYRVFERC